MTWLGKLIEAEKIPDEAGDFFDKYTYKGNLRSLVFWLCAFSFMWFFHEIYAWFGSLFDMSYEIDIKRQKWSRVMAVLIGGGGILVSVSLLVYLPFRRKKAIDSSKGQWYDKPDIKREDLYDSERKGE